MMFKILIIQTTNNLSDERAEFLINDRLATCRALRFDAETAVALLRGVNAVKNDISALLESPALASSIEGPVPSSLSAVNQYVQHDLKGGLGL
jgi:hypothetical protein